MEVEGVQTKTNHQSSIAMSSSTDFPSLHQVHQYARDDCDQPALANSNTAAVNALTGLDLGRNKSAFIPSSCGSSQPTSFKGSKNTSAEQSGVEFGRTLILIFAIIIIIIIRRFIICSQPECVVVVVEQAILH
eukprot:1540089-Rhodomonas_salina.1